MEDNLQKKWKTTSKKMKKMEDDLKKIEDDLHFLKMEYDLIFI